MRWPCPSTRDNGKPSFTLYSYGGVIDYVAGSGEDPQKQILTRDRIYWYDQIPAVVLGPRDLEKPNWDENLYAKLEQMYWRVFDPVRYAPAGFSRICTDYAGLLPSINGRLGLGSIRR